MDRNIQEREFGWTDSSESDQSEEVYDGDLDMEESSDEDLDLHAPLARHGPIIRANPSDLAIQREYWHLCAIAFLLDYKKFSVAHLQHTINNAWRIRGNVNVVGRDSRYFILHFDVLDDLLYICGEGPWAVDSALLVTEMETQPCHPWAPAQLCLSLGTTSWTSFRVSVSGTCHANGSHYGQL